MSWKQTLSMPLQRVTDITGLERRSINELIRAKELEAFQSGRKILVGTKSLLEYFERRGIQAPD
jgi:hypothetical protein